MNPVPLYVAGLPLPGARIGSSRVVTSGAGELIIGAVAHAVSISYWQAGGPSTGIDYIMALFDCASG